MNPGHGLLSPGALVGTMLAPLAALAFQLTPGQALLPLGPLIAVLGVAIPIPVLLLRAELREQARLTPILLLWLAPAAIAAASVTWSPLAGLSLQRVLLVFIAGAVLLLLASCDRRPWRTYQGICRGLALLACALAVIGLVLLVLGQTRLTSEGFVQSLEIGPLRVAQRLVGAPPLLRITSLSGNPNGLAIWLVFGLVLLPVAWPGRSARVLRWTMGSIIAVALLLTMSRTGIAAAIMALLIYRLVKAPLRLRSAVTATVLIAVGVAVVGTVLAEVGTSLLASDRLTLSLSDREEAWRPLLDAWAARPWTGQGFGIAFEALLRERGLRFGAHSGHLALLAEFGVLGYAGVLAIWGFAVWRGWTRVRSGSIPPTAGASCLAVLVAYFAQQFFEASLLRFTFASFFWLYVASLTGAAAARGEQA